MSRGETSTGRLARLGFADPAAALSTLAADPICGVLSDALLDDLAQAADPDLALRSLCRLLTVSKPDGGERLRTALLTDEQARQGIVAVLGVSEALADHLTRHPEDWELVDGRHPRLSSDAVRRGVLAAVGADAAAAAPVARAATADVQLALRVAYRRMLLGIVQRDLAGAPYDDTVADLSQAADAALEGALAIARAEVGAQNAAACRIAVIAMGKSGGQELNYVSDVDVIYVVESPTGDDAEAVRVGTQLATALMRVCSASSAEGTLWEVDAGLRPEGRAGALVRTLDSHLGYYERWAKTWEFQALLKARAAAGNADLGVRYVRATQALVWQSASRENFVEDVQAMRQRVERSVDGKLAGRQLKLGRGGLRDVEFSVQLLQLVHGRSDPNVRSPNTMRALEALADYGYVARKDAAGLGAAYRFLRTLEHRLQMYRLHRVHVVPEAERDLRRIARSLGFRTDPVAEFEVRWREEANVVRRLHEKLFYRPLLQAVARLDPGEARLSPAAAGDRLKALGFTDPDSALRHLQALTAGVSRRASIQRTLLPVLLSWFAEGPDPDSALLGFRQVSEALGSTPWYLRLLRDESVAAQRLSEILGSSRYTTDLLMRAPEAVSMLGSTGHLESRPPAALESEALASVARNDDPVVAISAVRAFRRRELFRVSTADVLRVTSVEETAEALTDVTAATITAALQAAVGSVAAEQGRKLGVRFLVVGMGRFGGSDMSYSSDADVMFVYETLPGTADDVAAKQSLGVATELGRLLALPSADPELVVDADLRPEGRNGPLVRSLASYAAYYQRWSAPWEAQALLRARPVSGDPGLGQDFLTLVDPLRYPAQGLSREHLVEMRRLKARMESERLPRGADPAMHTKLGPGGLSDVEWTAQMLQMQHAWRVPELRVTRTVPALEAAVAASLLAASDAEQLVAAWRIASRIRNATTLATGRPADSIPRDSKVQSMVAHLLGYSRTDSQLLVEEYRRATRRARRVVDRVFYGL